MSSKVDGKEEKTERFKTAASLLGKRAVKEKEHRLKIERGHNKILPIIHYDEGSTIENS